VLHFFKITKGPMLYQAQRQLFNTTKLLMQVLLHAQPGNTTKQLAMHTVERVAKLHQTMHALSNSVVLPYFTATANPAGEVRLS
jgi:hypothetical protein